MSHTIARLERGFVMQECSCSVQAHGDGYLISVNLEVRQVDTDGVTHFSVLDLHCIVAGHRRPGLVERISKEEIELRLEESLTRCQRDGIAHRYWERFVRLHFAVHGIEVTR